VNRVIEWEANKKQTAAFFGVSVQALDGWVNRGCPCEKRGRSLIFYQPETVQWRYSREDDSPLNLEQERARLASAQAAKVEMENQVKRGEYAPIEVLKFAVADFSSQAQSIFAGLPKLVKNSLPSLRAKEMKILEREIVKAQNAASQIQVTFNITDDS
jgi:phage terminase Nu1 subunit (DNA packaging protein)